MEGVHHGCEQVHREQVRHGYPAIRGADQVDEEEIEQRRTIVSYARAG